MTPLRTDLLPGQAPRAWLLVLLVAFAGLAGCLGDGDDGDDGTGGDGGNGSSADAFRIFLAALGDASPATATLSGAEVVLNGTDTTAPLGLDETSFDLADLSSSGQAILAASVDGTTGTANVTRLTFSSLTAGTTSLSNVVIEVPVAYPVGPRVEVTITLDLDATAADGEARFASLVADRGAERLKAITRAEVEAQEREEVPDLAQPVVTASAVEGNDTAPSFIVNDPISFTLHIEEVEAQVREVFWTFSDGTTTTGRTVEHTFRSPGPATARALVEGTRGQQATVEMPLDIYMTLDGEGNVGVGTGGTGAIDDRDVRDEPLDIIGPFTNITVRVSHSPSGNLCGPAGCAPSNVHIELIDPDGASVVEDTSADNPKFLNVSGEMPGGEWVLRVKGDQGAAIGFRYHVEVHYVGLSPGDGADEGDEDGA